jgi:hypothetical protein
MSLKLKSATICRPSHVHAPQPFCSVTVTLCNAGAVVMEFLWNVTNSKCQPLKHVPLIHADRKIVFSKRFDEKIAQGMVERKRLATLNWSVAIRETMCFGLSRHQLLMCIANGKCGGSLVVDSDPKLNQNTPTADNSFADLRHVRHNLTCHLGLW